jgi:uncharacterized membrane protein YidH (DUF202 family)
MLNIQLSINEIFKWLNLAVGLIEVEGFFAATSILGYFTLHESKQKDVKKIHDSRLTKARSHLSELAKECVNAKEITKDIEEKFATLFEDEYSKAYEPRNILSMMDFSFLLSGILFLASALLDWASSLPALQNLALSPVEGEVFIFGIFLLAFGILNLQRLRRMTEEETDIDPAPFNVILSLGLVFVTDVYLLWITGSIYSTLSTFGRALFYSSLVPFSGIVLAILTWDEENWKRNFGMILLFAPYFLILGAFILSVLRIPFP